VVAEAMHLPSSFEVSIEGLEAGAQITAADVTLPEGSELAVDPDFVLAVISQAQTAEQLEGDSESATETTEGDPESEATAAE
jgi:large subunit ribosomal protein L25